MGLFSKYYACEFTTLHGERLEIASCTFKMSRLYNPCDVTTAIRNYLKSEGLESHRIINLRRIK